MTYTYNDKEFTDEQWNSRNLTLNGFMIALVDIIFMAIYLCGIFASGKMFGVQIDFSAEWWIYLALMIMFLGMFIRIFNKVMRPKDWYQTIISIDGVEYIQD